MAVVTVYNNDNKNVLTQWRQHCTEGYCLYSIGFFADLSTNLYASLSVMVCQSWRFYGTTDKRV